MNIEKISSISFSNKGNIPLGLAAKRAARRARVMAADLGATKTNLAVFQVEGDEFEPTWSRSIHTRDYESFSEMFAALSSEGMPEVEAVCLGVAGPVIEGKVDGTNFPWHLDAEKIAAELSMNSVSLINDMEANAYGLAALTEDDFEDIKQGTHTHGNAAIISPGTGLGEAGLFWDGAVYHPFATEGGHCDFSPRHQMDVDIWNFFHKIYGHVSWERILSGPGILDLYNFLLDLHKEVAPSWFKDEEGDLSVQISRHARRGDDPMAMEAINLFFRFLAIESAQLALKFKALGGIYIGGGILPKIIGLMDKEDFQTNFLHSARLNHLLRRMPVRVILNDKAALFGAAMVAAASLQK